MKNTFQADFRSGAFMSEEMCTIRLAESERFYYYCQVFSDYSGNARLNFYLNF